VSSPKDEPRAWGRRLYEAQEDGPAWAASVLDAAQAFDSGITEVEAVIAVAADAKQRHLGHEVFDRTRDRYLAESRQVDPATTRLLLLRLAELVAAAAYNDTHPQGPFDAHKPWDIGPTAVELAAAVGDQIYVSEVRAALGAWPEEHAEPK
jgi:hypothetical protein